MKKYTQIGIAIVLSLTLFMRGGLLHAATYNFLPASTEVQPGNTFQVTIDIDALTDQVAGADVYLTYDNTIIQYQSVADGGYFPEIQDQLTADNRLYITGYVNAQGDYKTGAGTLATVTFSALTEGVATIAFDCDETQANTSKIVQNDTAVTNILDCSTLQTHTVTVSGAAADNGTSTTTTTVTELPQSGVVEDMIAYAIWGGIFVGIWAVLRIVLRIM